MRNIFVKFLELSFGMNFVLCQMREWGHSPHTNSVVWVRLLGARLVGIISEFED